MTDSSRLHILLTNDDGYQAPGIQALQQALNDAGHRVSMVAPSGQKSATSMSMTTRATMPLKQIDDRNWHLDGQPVDTVLVALRHLLADDIPDLVLSGINYGPNLGIGLHLSGTVGAAAIAVLNDLPAMAISAGMVFGEHLAEPLPFPTTHRILQPAARFTCSVIDSLHQTAQAEGRLLPRGVMLNINYPPLSEEDILGVAYPEISTGHMVELDYSRCSETGHVIPEYHRNAWEAEQEAGDIRAHMEGYITISAVRPNWNLPPEDVDAIRDRLNGIEGNLGG